MIHRISKLFLLIIFSDIRSDFTFYLGCYRCIIIGCEEYHGLFYRQGNSFVIQEIGQSGYSYRVNSDVDIRFHFTYYTFYFDDLFFSLFILQGDINFQCNGSRPLTYKDFSGINSYLTCQRNISLNKDIASFESDAILPAIYSINRYCDRQSIYPVGFFIFKL